MRPGFALSLLVMCSAAPSAYAGLREEAPIERDAARPALGEWTGSVSWNDPPVSYGWSIYPQGDFTSGRLGRGQNGGGTWGTHGARLTLKYADGFRYEGQLHAHSYAGSAYLANGRRFGAFAMHRAGLSKQFFEEAP